VANFLREESVGRLTSFSLIKHANGEQASVLTSQFFGQVDEAVSGELAWAEANDVVSMSGTVAGSSITGTINWTEVNDVLAIATNVRINGAMSSQDQNDTFAASGTLRVNASAGWAEPSDICGFVGVVRVNGSFALQDQSDTLAATMNVAESVLGAIEWQEQNDILLILANTFQFARAPRGDVGQSTRPAASNGSRPARNLDRMERPSATQRGTR